MVHFTADLNNREDNCFCSTENILFLQPEVKQAILIWGCFVLFFKMLLNKKTGGFKMKEIIWECKAKVIWEHILYTFYFQNVKTESWDGAGWVEGGWGMIFFPLLFKLNFIPSVISTLESPANSFLQAHCMILPKGSLDPFLLKCARAGKDDAHYLSLPRLPLRNLQGCLFSYKKICPSSWNLALLAHPSCLSSTQDCEAERVS